MDLVSDLIAEMCPNLDLDPNPGYSCISPS